MADEPRLSNRHKRTLSRIFAHPVPSDIPWRDIERVFIALGAEVKELRGSRVSVTLGGIVHVFHRPHPQPETDRGAVVDVRSVLIAAGVSP